MSLQHPPPHELDHLVSNGNVSGPRREHLWERVSARVLPRAAWWRRPRVVVAALGGLAVAAGMLVLVPSGGLEKNITLRGPASAAPPLLEATCGSPAQPCAVGQPITLRVLPHGLTGVVMVTVWTNTSRQLVGRVDASLGPAQVLGNTVTPDEADRGHPLRVEAFWLPAAPADQDLPGWLKQPHGVRSLLSLDVAP